MKRPPKPGPTQDAQRALVRLRLAAAGLDLATADRWCDRWLVEADVRGLPHDAGYWPAGERWIVAKLTAKHRPGAAGRRDD
jgi:hypothetical protein